MNDNHIVDTNKKVEQLDDGNRKVHALVRFKVTEKAMRPASTEKRCFYCGQEIGEDHKPDCVLITKRVKIRMTVEYEIKVPNFWDKEMIEFHRNESSWCASNALDELLAIDGSDDKPCLCSFAEFEYLGGDTEPFLDE